MSKSWLLALLALLILLVSCTESRSPRGSSPEAQPTLAAPVDRHTVLGTYSMEWKPSWYSRTRVTSIGYHQLQLSTAPITTNDPCSREGSLRQLRSHDSFVFAYTRPDFFIGGRKFLSLHEQDLDHLRLAEKSFGRFDVGGVTCAPTYWVIVRSNDQHIMVFLAFGRDASPELKRQTLQVFETLRPSEDQN